MTGEIDNIITNLFSLGEKLHDLENSIELYANNQFAISLLTSLTVMSVFKLFDYLIKEDVEDTEDHDSDFETDSESDHDELHSGCGSDSSGLSDHEENI